MLELLEQLEIFMKIHEQIQYRMDFLKMSYKQLAERCGVSEQTVRFWASGRNAPKRDRVTLVEQALSFKLDFSEGRIHGETAESFMVTSEIKMLANLRKLPPSIRVSLGKLIESIVAQASGPGNLQEVVSDE